MQEKILITGGGGFVARETAECLNGRFDIVAEDKSGCDVTDPESLRRALDKHRPDILIHLAAWVDKAQCERFPGAARYVNAVGAENTARECTAAGVRVVYISTDFVFDGALNRPYTESDKPNPINVYGASKREGEIAVAQLAPDSLIVRTSRLFGKYGKSFISILPALLRTERRLPVASDMVSGITYAPDFAKTLGALIEEKQNGLFHVTNAGECTIADFAGEIAAATSSKTILEPVPWETLMPDVPAPLYCVLGTERAQIAAAPLRHWRDAIKDFLGET